MFPSRRLSPSGLSDTNLSEGTTPFFVTGPREEDAVIVLMVSGADWSSCGADPLQPGSIWCEGVNERGNVLCPVRDAQSGQGDRGGVSLCPLLFFFFSLPLTPRVNEFKLQLDLKKKKKNSVENLVLNYRHSSYVLAHQWQLHFVSDYRHPALKSQNI